MTTLLLLPALFSSDGGIERILRLYVRAVGELSAASGLVHAVVLNDAGIPASQLAPYATPALQPAITCNRRKLSFAWHAVRLARRSDRVICGHVNLLRLAHLARRFAPKPEVWLIAHGIEVWRDFSSGEREALRATNRILCVSDFTRRQLAERVPALPARQLVVQPNALDPRFEISFADAPAATEPGLILSVARLSRAEAYKGIDHLIAALPAIVAAVPAARLRIVGDGDDRGRLEALAAQSPARDRIQFTGRVDDAALRRHLGACQLFALPSRGEGFGLVYLEALAQGKPCIAAEAGGAPEVVDAASGTLVPFGDVAALARACSAALRREWNPTALRARAAEFSYEVFRRRLAALWPLPA